MAKRRLEICRKCSRFKADVFLFYCFSDIGVLKMGGRYAIPYAHAVWKRIEIPLACEMKAEYLLEEWNENKKKD